MNQIVFQHQKHQDYFHQQNYKTDNLKDDSADFQKVIIHPIQTIKSIKPQEQIVGKDHNKLKSFDIYPYNEDFGKKLHETQQIQQRSSYYVESSSYQNKRFPKLIIILFGIVIFSLAGLLYWFFKPKDNDNKILPLKINKKTGFVKRTSIKGISNQLLAKIISQLYHCPSPAFIYNNKCIKCPKHAVWNGTNCLQYYNIK